jgi:hypothetical protein
MNFGLLAKNGSRLLKGKVVNAVTNAPIGDPTVTAKIKDPEEKDEEKVVKTYQAKCGADGMFTVEVPVKDTKDGEYYTVLEVEKPGCDYVVFDRDYGSTAGGIDEDMINFAVAEYEYQLSSDEDMITVQGAVYTPEGEPLKTAEVDFSGVYFSKMCAKGCCGDMTAFDVEFAEKMKPDNEGRFSFKTKAIYVFGLKNGMKVGFDGDEKTYRAIFEQGMDSKSRDFETESGKVLSLEFSVDGN